MAQDLTTKQEQIGSLKEQVSDLESELQCKEGEVMRTHLKLSDLVTQISSFRTTLQTQRTALNDFKVNVQEKYRDVMAEQHSKVVSNIALTCEKFAQEKRDLEESLRKVNCIKKGIGRTIITEGMHTIKPKMTFGKF